MYTYCSIFSKRLFINILACYHITVSMRGVGLGDIVEILMLRRVFPIYLTVWQMCAMKVNNEQRHSHIILFNGAIASTHREWCLIIKETHDCLAKKKLNLAQIFLQHNPASIRQGAVQPHIHTLFTWQSLKWRIQ